jgi:hypothetical protein
MDAVTKPGDIRTFVAGLVSTPASAWDVKWLHSDSVWRSYMTSAELNSRPEVPKLNTRSSRRRSNAMAVLHNGQYVTPTGTSSQAALTVTGLTPLVAAEGV